MQESDLLTKRCFGYGSRGWEKWPNTRNLLRTVTFWPTCLLAPIASKKLCQCDTLVVYHPPPKKVRILGQFKWGSYVVNHQCSQQDSSLVVLLIQKFQRSLFTWITTINGLPQSPECSSIALDRENAKYKALFYPGAHFHVLIKNSPGFYIMWKGCPYKTNYIPDTFKWSGFTEHTVYHWIWKPSLKHDCATKEF